MINASFYYKYQLDGIGVGSMGSAIRKHWVPLIRSAVNTLSTYERLAFTC